MSKKDLALKKYEISKERYRELKYFCLQYEEWKRQLSYFGMSVKSPQLTGMPGGKNGVSDPTADEAVKRSELTVKCALVEQTAIETDSELYSYLIKSVTQDIPYEYINVPCGRRRFYEMRRRFFFFLSKKR